MGTDILIVAALLRRERQFLLVRQQTANEPHQVWALPGGATEPGELLVEALARVVREQIGIEVVRAGDLIHVAQSHTPREHGWPGGALTPPGSRATSFVFEVVEWKGETGQVDPDGRILENRFWPRDEAIDHLERHPSRALREPILAYLRGQERQLVWLYRLDGEGLDKLEWPSQETSPEVNEQMRRARAFVALGCIVVLAILIIIVIIGIITLGTPFV